MDKHSQRTATILLEKTVKDAESLETLTQKPCLAHFTDYHNIEADDIIDIEVDDKMTLKLMTK